MNIKAGDKVTFHSERLTSGNPVKGTVESISEEWIDIKLDHTCEGIVNIWDKGEVKTFRRSLISGLKKITK